SPGVPLRGADLPFTGTGLPRGDAPAPKRSFMSAFTLRRIVRSPNYHGHARNRRRTSAHATRLHGDRSRVLAAETPAQAENPGSRAAVVTSRSAAREWPRSGL